MQYQTYNGKLKISLYQILLTILTIGSLSKADIIPLGNDTYKIPSRNFYEIQAVKLENDWLKKKLNESLNDKRPELQISAGVCTARGIYAEAGVGIKL